MSRCEIIMLGATRLIACLVATTVVTSIHAQANAPIAAASTAQSVPSDADLAGTHCAIGEETFLPADYYYCLGTQTYGAQRYRYAKRFFTTAASWASKPAQYVLGVMALNGDHQPVNKPLALAWFALASERPNSKFKAMYTSTDATATPTERQAAEQLLSTMRPIYADPTAAVRAEKRYAAGMAMLAHLNNGGNQYCVAGASSLATGPTDPSMCLPVQTVVGSVDRVAADVFDGWSGHVTVEPLQQVANPSSASSTTR